MNIIFYFVCALQFLMMWLHQDSIHKYILVIDVLFLDFYCFRVIVISIFYATCFQDLLSKGYVNERLAILIKSALTIPYGSAEVERGFNILNNIRGKDKWLLSTSSLNGLMKIRIDGEAIGPTLEVDKFTNIYRKH